MKKLLHTPVPWEISLNSWIDWHCDINAAKWGALAVVVTHLEEEISPEGMANAKLIAAAPEMLEQLIDLYEFIKDVQSSFGSGILDSIILDNTKNIIEKATGMKIDEVI